MTEYSPGYVWKVLERLDIEVDTKALLNPSSPAATVHEQLNVLRQAANVLRAELSVSAGNLPNATVEFRKGQRLLTQDEKRSLYGFLGKFYDEDVSCLVDLKKFLRSTLDTIDFLIHEEEQKHLNAIKAERTESYDRFVGEFTAVQILHNQLVDVLRTMRGEELKLTKLT